MALSGISTSAALKEAFASFISTGNDRALVVEIANEALEPVATIARAGSETDDFDLLGSYLKDNEPAYILWKADDPLQGCSQIAYVPDAAPVRQKMLYSSSKAALVKELGESNFSESHFATHKDELTPAAYKKHLAHKAAPNPTSQAEKDKELVDRYEKLEVRDERQTAGWSAGSASIGLKFADNAVSGVMEMVAGSVAFLTLNIEVASETIQLGATGPQLDVPATEPSYSFYSFQSSTIFIYSCPPLSPIKSRLLYSSSVQGVLAKATELGLTVTKKVETSDPQEVTDDFLAAELAQAAQPEKPASPAFAKPKRPGRK